MTTPERTYPQGNAELLTMFESQTFDRRKNALLGVD